MNKKGLIGKIFAVIGIIFLIIIVIIGFTIYQAYDLYKTAQQESKNMQDSVAALQNGDCSKIASIEASINNIKTKAGSACKNPLISYAVEKMPQVQIKCKDIPTLEQQMQSSLSQIKGICANKTITNTSITAASNTTQ